MNNFQEIELKLRIEDPQVYEQILNDPLITSLRISEPRVKEYETIYYDTQEHYLIKNQICYRIRRFLDGYTATVKGFGTSQDGLSIRKEWNRKLDNDTPTIKPFDDSAIGKELERIIGNNKLTPIFKTCFRRTALELKCADGSAIELAVDIGDIVSGKKTEAICEVELELKSGTVDNILKIGESLLEHHPLIREDKSKYERGLKLVGIEG